MSVTRKAGRSGAGDVVVTPTVISDCAVRGHIRGEFSYSADRSHIISHMSQRADDHDGEGRDLAVLDRLAATYDRHDMQRVITRTPDHIDIALESVLPAMPSAPVSRPILVGLGGSALPADVLNDAFAEELRAPVEITRTYRLPGSVDETTLVIASSFSGNTEEVLAALRSLDRNHRQVVVVTAGGALAELARERRYPVVRIPKEKEPPGFQPRCAIGYVVTYLARILTEVGLMSDPVPRLQAASRLLRGVDVRTSAWKMACCLEGRVPIVYTDESHALSVARVAKIKFNENAKTPAFFNAIPEMNHNEMIGFSAGVGTFAALYIHDADTHPSIQKRFHVMQSVFEQEQLSHVTFHEWQMPGESRVERVFGALTFADWCSFSLGLLAGRDPTPVELVERFKGVLAAE